VSLVQLGVWLSAAVDNRSVENKEPHAFFQKASKIKCISYL
jgi:hypothetical protein